ncbi:glycoside hydrolase family 43 protein [Armillaria novae-zelandiae]|uniref:Glycoside hydrolase family 43 protein n=1 Tax=Armillaria novae-zelandiae TaxID=153914 RepID=A0AA39U292_9AGAR|nr:glycoside hydrolase family 43 protein [Armillaria novae-zelandiae]
MTSLHPITRPGLSAADIKMPGYNHGRNLTCFCRMGNPVLAVFFICSLLIFLARAFPSPRQHDDLVGYFFVHFYDREASVFAHLSNGNDPLSYQTLNRDDAILVPTGGTGGVRDPFLVSSPDKSKFWIIGTDLLIEDTNWDAATRTGSRSLYVWESSDQLAEVVGEAAGMAWAPEAIWDADAGQYLVYWSSRFYDADDTAHTGTATEDRIVYAYTSDFQTFTEATDYIVIPGTPIIDLTILALSDGEYIRFIKNKTDLRVWSEHSSNGLFGTWTKIRDGYVNPYVTEGPLAFHDNEGKGRIHLWLDEYGGDTRVYGYVPQYTDDGGVTWMNGDRANFPTLTKHGVVMPVNQTQYGAIKAKWA